MYHLHQALLTFPESQVTRSGYPGPVSPKSTIGRPRDPAIEGAVLTAALRRLATDGYTRMTLAAVARDAGITKPTLYLRWPTKHDLVVAALMHARSRDAAEDEAIDLAAATPVDAVQLTLEHVTCSSVEYLLLGNRLFAEMADLPDLFEIYQTHCFQPRVHRLTRVLQRVVDSGDLPDGLDLTLVADMLIGAYHSTLQRTGTVDPDLAHRLVNTLIPALHPTHRQPPTAADRGRAR